MTSGVLEIAQHQLVIEQIGAAGAAEIYLRTHF